jgi:uncharacterized iron-regulated membrane protein
MLKMKTLKRWFAIHKWTSLICTLFLLMLCITGLPLIFHEEIDHWLEPHPYENLPATTAKADLDKLVNASLKQRPDLIPTSLFIDDEEPQVIVSMSTSWKEAMKEHSDSNYWARYDARTAKLLEQSKPLSEQPSTFMNTMLELHISLFTGLPGELFLGLMGLLFVLALISGMVLYAPFMKKLRFGSVRKERSRRLKWLDLHNLLGIVALAWTFVVGVTGVINELSTPLFGLWQMTDVQKMLVPYQGKPAPGIQELSSVQAAFEKTKEALPDMTVTSIVYPGAPYASPQHYLLWAKGNTPLRSQLFDPVLVDARTGTISAIVSMPWYLRALELSRPLHFGDYGGLPLKIIWAIFDLITILVLVSGLYLWFLRRRSNETYFSRLFRNTTAEEISK